MQPAFAVKQVEYGGTLVADYRSLRILLWPDCEEDCDREIGAILSDPDRWAAFIVSLDGEGAAGFLELHLREFAEGTSSSPVAFIEGWFVIPQQRGRGLGRALVKAAESWAVCRGCNELGSDTQANNDLSIAVHQKLGFREVERLVCFLKRLDS